MLLAEEVVENMKEQIHVLMPDFDVSLIGKLKKGSLQIKKRNLEAKQSRVPRICVACCSYPNPRLSKLTTLRRGNSLDQIHAYA
ncbi:hypothetical protein PIB30_040271 [Stylosanthes scabra]|uniref:Uncharacterized protein n=1 Tax=Stylosanthes scabra TaxID=79078 RepID=A0ABU6WCQ8_9FABA|nr:hypothetical protein [Stylosanthes scabra]